MKVNPKISVIVPVYNVEAYLAKCIDSIIGQSYKNLEIIIVNDCSPDNSQQIIADYAQHDSRIISIIHQSNKRQGGARNTGIEIATGDYIAFVDSDDFLELNAFELIIGAFAKYPDAEIVKFGRIEDYGDYQISLSPMLAKEYYQDGWQAIKDALYAKKFRGGVSENVYSTQLIKANNIRFKENAIYEDTFFLFKAQVLASGMVLLDNCFYHYKKDRLSSTINTISERDTDVLIAIEMLEDFLKATNRYDILESYEYQWLIYDWVAYCVLYYYQQVSGKEDIKAEVFNKIVSHAIFRKYLLYLSKHAKSMRHRIPATLLLKNHFLFKLFVKTFFAIKKLKALHK